MEARGLLGESTNEPLVNDSLVRGLLRVPTLGQIWYRQPSVAHRRGLPDHSVSRCALHRAASCHSAAIPCSYRRRRTALVASRPQLKKHFAISRSDHTRRLDIRQDSSVTPSLPVRSACTPASPPAARWPAAPAKAPAPSRRTQQCASAARPSPAG